MTALERLSEINSEETFENWFHENEGYDSVVKDIQEVVALAKANQQPSIDAMRFEAAKAAMQGYVSHYGLFGDFAEENAKKCVLIADAIIFELKNTKL